jgi:hypothetical protein
MAIPAGMIALGAGMQAYGTYMASKSAAEAARQQAKLKKAQIDELLSKMSIQENRIDLQGEAFKAKQITDYAAGGVQLGTGATLIALEDTNMKINQQTEDMKRDTMFKVNQLKLGAKLDLQQASDTSRAGMISSIATLATGAAETYKYS